MCLTKPNRAHNRMESKPKPKQTKVKEHPIVRKCKSIFGAQFPFDKWVTAVHKHPTSLFQEDTLIMVTSNGDIRRGSYTIDYTTIDPVRYQCSYTCPPDDFSGCCLDKQGYRLSSRKYNGSDEKYLFISPLKDAPSPSTKSFELFGQYCPIVVLGKIPQSYKRNRACD